MKYPLGPWAEDNSARQQYADDGVSSYTESTIPSEVRALSYNVYPNVLSFNAIDTRSGFNSGKLTSKTPVTSASLHKKQVETLDLCEFHKMYASGSAGTTHTDGKVLLLSHIGTDVATSDLLGETINKCFSKLTQKANGPFTGTTFVGESPEMIRDLGNKLDFLCGHNYDSTKSLVKTVLKNKAASALALARIVSTSWLDYQFAIKPTINDVGNLISAYVNKQADLAPTFIKASYVQTSSDSVRYAPVNMLAQIAVLDVSIVEYMAKMGYRVVIDNVTWDAAPAVDKSYGLTLNDAVPALWELTPYSWMSDYFLNLNQIFDAYSVRRGTSSFGWQVTMVKKTHSSVWDPLTWYDGGPLSSVKRGGCVVKDIQFSRIPLNVDSFYPSLEFSSPSAMQAANMAALAVTRLVKPLALERSLPRPKWLDMNRLFRSSFTRQGFKPL